MGCRAPRQSGEEAAPGLEAADCLVEGTLQRSQIAGLGRSATSQYYALAGREEARDYLAHPVLGQRLVECAAALRALGSDDPVAILGGTDAQKLQSCMSLFAYAADQGEDRAVFRAVLEQYYGGIRRR